MRYLSPSDIRQALSYEEMMAAVEEAFLLFAQGRCAMANRTALTQGSTTLATMPCFAGGYAATKLLASCPDNPRRGLPSLYGTVLLSQGDTGRVKQLFLQYRDRMTPLQKRRFEKLMGKYNIPMTE